MSTPDPKIPGHPKGLAHETRNREQDDAGTQAQDVAEDARREDSRTGDLIDEMNRMEGEGSIDMSAFAGEPNHDDETETYGGETTDDDDAEWLTADGEALNEEEEEEDDNDEEE